MELNPEYVAARSVLLDALMALGSQRESVILVGAQGVYLRAVDRREFAFWVAGPSALLVAKLIKLHERLQAGDNARVREKDALDVFRLLRIDLPELHSGFQRHSRTEFAAAVSADALSVLRDHGTKRASALPKLAGSAVGGDQVIEASFVALATELLSALDA